MILCQIIAIAAVFCWICPLVLGAETTDTIHIVHFGDSITAGNPGGQRIDELTQAKLRMETIGAGGGYLMSPTHFIEPEVPWVDIMAFVDAARKHGRYD